MSLAIISGELEIVASCTTVKILLFLRIALNIVTMILELYTSTQCAEVAHGYTQ